jgi:glycerol kinase
MPNSPKKGNTLVLDVGTTGAKAIVFNQSGEILGRSYQRLETNYPEPGFAEQNGENIIETAKNVIREVTQANNLNPRDIKSVGLTNQRETIIAWRRDTRKSLHPAILWEDTRSARLCSSWETAFGEKVIAKTGLPIDPYFSASKIHWLLDNVPGVQQALQDQQLLVGTLDTWLLWNLTQEQLHVTDHTNASRTLLFDITTKQWDSTLLNLFQIPPEILPQVYPSRYQYGTLTSDILGVSLPIQGVCGDQQASLYAAGTETGTTKVTYGTGTFIMQTIGSDFALHPPFYTTLTPGEKGDTLYAFEAKASRGGKEVDLLLEDPPKLKEFLNNLVREVSSILTQLPRKPQIVVIDGGVIRDGIVKKIQPKLSGLPVKEQLIFDGTALGMFYLITH